MSIENPENKHFTPQEPETEENTPVEFADESEQLAAEHNKWPGRVDDVVKAKHMADAGKDYMDRTLELEEANRDLIKKRANQPPVEPMTQGQEYRWYVTHGPTERSPPEVDYERKSEIEANESRNFTRRLDANTQITAAGVEYDHPDIPEEEVTQHPEVMHALETKKIKLGDRLKQQQIDSARASIVQQGLGLSDEGTRLATLEAEGPSHNPLKWIKLSSARKAVERSKDDIEAAKSRLAELENGINAEG